MLSKNLAFYIFGANTDIGKTIFTAGLCQAACQSEITTKYIKPVQTGYPHSCDANFIAKYVQNPALHTTTLHTIEPAISAHRGQADYSVENILENIQYLLSTTSNSCIFIEGAGGIASPFLDGNLQCDIYRKILLPIIFIADSRLGGISTSIASIELAQARGFDIACILLFAGEHYNADFLAKYFQNKIPVFCCKNLNADMLISDWLAIENLKFLHILSYLQRYHLDSLQKVKNAICTAKDAIWWPFTQHATAKAARFINSALHDEIELYKLDENISSAKYYDASASWWTQAIGHGNLELLKAASYAIGRYGHVLFPGNIHLPAANLAQKLLSTVGCEWAQRVFFSDNGSTANEVAIKMAFRKSFGTTKVYNPIIIGLENSYHGDTLANLDATNPNAFKQAEHWYNPRGYWLQYPKVYFKNKRYIIVQSALMEQAPLTEFQTLTEIFSPNRIYSSLAPYYLRFIQAQFDIITAKKLNIGACLLEGIIMGSGGMQFVDPLFQKILIDFCQQKNIPVILDEVFTGFWRLGSMSAAHMLNIKPDIACYGKLITGGLLPMGVTLAREDIFKQFLGENLSSALLHGHSYTANPIICNVGIAAIDTIMQSPNFNVQQNELNNLWDLEYCEKISQLTHIERVVCLGSLFAIELTDQYADYYSNIAKELIDKLERNYILARPLGNVVYLLADYNTNKAKLRNLLIIFYDALVQTL